LNGPLVGKPLATLCDLVLFLLSSLLFPGQETFRRSIRRWRARKPPIVQFIGRRGSYRADSAAVLRSSVSALRLHRHLPDRRNWTAGRQLRLCIPQPRHRTGHDHRRMGARRRQRRASRSRIAATPETNSIAAVPLPRSGRRTYLGLHCLRRWIHPNPGGTNLPWRVWDQIHNPPWSELSDARWSPDAACHYANGC